MDSENESKPSESENSVKDLKRINDVLQTLEQALDLKDRGGMSQIEFQELKKKLFNQAGIKLIDVVDNTSQPIKLETFQQAGRLTTISFFAGQLHELIVKQIEENFRLADGRNNEYMRYLVTKLVELRALHPLDKSYLNKLIDVICDETIDLEAGLRKINAIDEEIKEDINTSEAARTLSGITYSSAKRALKLSLLPNKPATRNIDLWNAVEEDFLGGLTGVSTFASIASMPGFSLAALGFAAAVSFPLVWIPAVGGLIGAGITSGWKYAKIQFS